MYSYVLYYHIEKFGFNAVSASLLFVSLECSENEKKAQEEYDKIYEGMKEVNDKMKVITDAKKEKETACKKIVK